jgi:hypothetical protein
VNSRMIEDLAKLREAELRMSTAPRVTRSAEEEGRGRQFVSRHVLLRGRALLGRLLVEAGLHLLATID